MGRKKTSERVCVLLVRVTALLLPYLLIRQKATNVDKQKKEKNYRTLHLVNFTQVRSSVYETGIIKETKRLTTRIFAKHNSFHKNIFITDQRRKLAE